jgi:hypothetical protein
MIMIRTRVGCHLVPKHIEIRALYDQDKPGIEQVNWSGSEQIQARVLYSPDKPGIKQVK